MTGNPADLLADASGDPYGRSPVEGYVTAPPADVDALLHVAVPSLDSDQDVGPLRWMPRGATLPQLGDRVLVVFTSDGSAWVAAWWSS